MSAVCVFLFLLLMELTSLTRPDNRPQPKPHFAAVQPAPPKLAPAVLQAIPVHATGSGAGVTTILNTTTVAGPSRGQRPSRVPRPSAVGTGLVPSLHSRSSSRPSILEKPEPPAQLTDKEIDERVGFYWVILPNRCNNATWRRLQGRSKRKLHAV